MARGWVDTSFPAELHPTGAQLNAFIAEALLNHVSEHQDALPSYLAPVMEWAVKTGAEVGRKFDASAALPEAEAEAAERIYEERRTDIRSQLDRVCCCPLLGRAMMMIADDRIDALLEEEPAKKREADTEDGEHPAKKQRTE